MIVLGRIVAPFGIRGWLRIHPFGDDPESWKSVRQWRLSADAEASDECWSMYKCEAIKLHGDGVLAKLAGVDDRNGSEALAGQFLGAPREALPVPKKGEYYWADLVGLSVVTLQN